MGPIPDGFRGCRFALLSLDCKDSCWGLLPEWIPAKLRNVLPVGTECHRERWYGKIRCRNYRFALLRFLECKSSGRSSGNRDSRCCLPASIGIRARCIFGIWNKEYRLPVSYISQCIHNPGGRQALWGKEPVGGLVS